MVDKISSWKFTEDFVSESPAIIEARARAEELGIEKKEQLEALAKRLYPPKPLVEGKPANLDTQGGIGKLTPEQIDKMSMDFRGDPASALLEVLDPEQNHAFNDHYLDLDYDLSDVMFITTANQIHQIPLPLHDRLEIIELPGYTEWEKVSIAKQYLIPKQVEANGLKDLAITWTDEALTLIVHRYTKEAGVRNFERELATVCRKIAKEHLASGRTATAFEVSPARLADWLGVEKFREARREKDDEIGLANGLAVTAFGGDLLSTEVTIVPGKGKLTLTGKLGEVMQESAQAAMSYLRSRAGTFGLSNDFQTKIDIHVHFPEGAIPKDGPSAGITMATAMASALLRIPVRQTIAMTGEVTLRGRVLPIGGLKEKLLAALRGGIKIVLIPEENVKDLAEIPANAKAGLEIIPVSHVDEVLARALTQPLVAIEWTEADDLASQPGAAPAGANPAASEVPTAH
jgi:ATP-dependent Lon protease